jgi:multidrug efflux pump subunit AcrB
MGPVKKQFFPTSDRPELLVEVQMPKAPRSADQRGRARGGNMAAQAAEVQIVTTYVGQGAPRFYVPLSPELPDPSFAKIIVRTGKEADRDALKLRLRQAAGQWAGACGPGAGDAAGVRPAIAFPVAFRVNGPDLATVRAIAARVQ